MTEAANCPTWLRLASTTLHRLPFRRGKTRLARWLARRVKPGGLVVTTRDRIRIELPSLNDPIAHELLAHGRYEESVDGVILKHLLVGGTFVDVGANVGVFTCRMARHVGASGRVVAIEASPVIGPILERNVARNRLANVQVVRQAATDRAGTLDFYTAPEHSMGMGSLAKQFDQAPVSVVARTLEAILDELNIGKVDVIKVDVEGFEKQVFAGAHPRLTGRRRPHIVFEFLDWAEQRAGLQPGDAQRELLNLGYNLHTIDDWKPVVTPLPQPLTTGSAMILAVPQELTSPA